MSIRKNSIKETALNELDLTSNEQHEEETYREQTIIQPQKTDINLIHRGVRKRAHSTSFSIQNLLEHYNNTMLLDLTNIGEKKSIGKVGIQSGNWENTLAKIAKSIVSIKANHVRSFDTETSGAYNATGFIVDAENGIILSNRHVVSPAPIVASAILFNYEEVELKAIYRDPIHDFGFLKFDASKVRFLELKAIELKSESAKVGLDIRVIGNDAGEKLSILAGTLARLDRKAPDYGIGEYNDFNTFYYQAASGTSGGSSGSPVININGDAIALNAGGSNHASSSFYLPLNRIKRALDYVRKGEVVPRGTLQTEFEHLPYDEVRRLGLKQNLEELFRSTFPNNTGLLVVNQVLIDGPAHSILTSGDIILKVQNKLITNFISLYEIVDDSVDQQIELEVSRGSKILTLKVKIQDLHSITPDRFVEIGGGIVHQLSYQVAKSYNHPVKGVYVATSGHMLGSASTWRKSIILAIDHKATPDLNAFIEVCKTLSDGARVPIRFYDVTKAYKEKVMVMHVDRHWHPFRVATRNDKTGLWDFDNLPEPISSIPYEPCSAKINSISENLKPGDKLNASFVSIDFHLPYLVDGMKTSQFCGAGVIADVDKGLIICDRDTVPISIGDIFITFASSIVIPGKLIFLHPIYNFSIIKYDPKLLGTTPLKPIKMLEGSVLKQGDSVYFVGISSDHSFIVKKTKVSGINNISTKECIPPRWRAINVESIKLDHSIVSLGGVLCNDQGEVYALWMNYSYQDEKGHEISLMAGLSCDYTLQVINSLKKNQIPVIRGMDVEFWSIRISSARTLGLSDDWVDKIEASELEKPQVLYILNKISKESASATKFKEGDLILQANGSILARMRDLDKLLSCETIDFTVLREGKEIQFTIDTTPLYGQETEKLISWSGALIQNPNRAVLEQVKVVPQGVYVSCTLYGSPVNTYNLRPGVWITEINGNPISGLDSFLDLVKKLNLESNDGYARIVTISRVGATKVLSLKMDLHYWPTTEIFRDPSAFSGWKCRLIE